MQASARSEWLRTPFKLSKPHLSATRSVPDRLNLYSTNTSSLPDHFWSVWLPDLYSIIWNIFKITSWILLLTTIRSCDRAWWSWSDQCDQCERLNYNIHMKKALNANLRYTWHQKENKCIHVLQKSIPQLGFNDLQLFMLVHVKPEICLTKHVSHPCNAQRHILSNN